MNPRELVAFELAHAVIAGARSADAFVESLALALGRKHRWITPLARRMFARFGSSLDHPMHAALVAFIAGDEAFRDAWTRRVVPRIRHRSLAFAPMQPRKGALAACVLPSLPTPGDIARWLGLEVAELDWFADLRQLNGRAASRLGHYNYRWIGKREGHRLIEIPKSRLREIQRRIHREILSLVPAHRAAHGFVRGRSCLTFARPHVDRLAVLRMDLRNFFASISAGRVAALFRALGYPEASARVLAALCTHSPGMKFLRAPGTPAIPMRERMQLERRHLPQGAPTSPALANLCALHLDLRLDGLARTMACEYTRYADDLAISGGDGLRRTIDRVPVRVAAIALEEGFELNHRKTRAMHASHRQVLTGLVVNRVLNIPRHEFDALKAILHNCARTSPSTQNHAGRRDFQAHLAGRIEHLRSVHPARGAKLRAMFDRIPWATSAAS